MQALAKYAFGLGSLTMFASTVVFTLMSLPPGKGIGTQILVKVGAPGVTARELLSACALPHLYGAPDVHQLIEGD